jgi:DNA invertase Pin-like site-specific DNA recombinase
MNPITLADVLTGRVPLYIHQLAQQQVRREFDMIAVWSSDRLGRSMSHLIEVLETIKGTGVGLYIHTQALDTTTPAGRAMFQMLDVFAEFEREMIRERVNNGLDRVRGEIKRKGRYETKNGHTIKRLGRPGAEPHKIEQARALLAAGTGMRKIGKIVGLGTSTVQKLKNEMLTAEMARSRIRLGKQGEAHVASLVSRVASNDRTGSNSGRSE